MADCKPVSTPIDTGTNLERNDNESEIDGTLYKQMVRSLRYLFNTRPGILFAVGLVSRFMEKPRSSHLVAVKRILRYIKGTQDCGILFTGPNKNTKAEIYGYTDSDWSGDKDDRKSTGGYVFMCGKASISWCSKKQSVVALSSCEAECIATSFAACQAS